MWGHICHKPEPELISEHSEHPCILSLKSLNKTQKTNGTDWFSRRVREEKCQPEREESPTSEDDSFTDIQIRVLDPGSDQDLDNMSVEEEPEPETQVDGEYNTVFPLPLLP